MATAVVSAPGKINLTLDILGRREDGYHEMEMLMHAVSLENTVRLTTRDRPGICLSCSNPAVPTGEKNLAYRAAQAFFAAWGHSVGLEIRVEKRVPMEAGMAGGSADAAGVLTGLNRIAGGAFPGKSCVKSACHWEPTFPSASGAARRWFRASAKKLPHCRH